MSVDAPECESLPRCVSLTSRPHGQLAAVIDAPLQILGTMKKRTKLLLFGSLPLVAVAGFFAPPPSDITRILRGQEGRYADIATIERMMDKNDFSHLPQGFYELRVRYKDGSSIQVVCSDSHQGGGTIGVLESNGTRHFYFGHVCGGILGLPLTCGKDKFEPDQRKFGHDKSDGLVKIK